MVWASRWLAHILPLSFRQRPKDDEKSPVKPKEISPFGSK